MDSTNYNFEDCLWFKEWKSLAKKDYRGHKSGYWICYLDNNQKLIYKYIKNPAEAEF